MVVKAALTASNAADEALDEVDELLLSQEKGFRSSMTTKKSGVALRDSAFSWRSKGRASAMECFGKHF